MQHGDKFELRINNQSFTHLWDNGNLNFKFSADSKGVQTDSASILTSEFWILTIVLCDIERTKKNFSYDGVARDSVA